MSAAAADPAALQIPGDQRHDGDGLDEVGRIDGLRLRLRNAEAPLAQRCAQPMPGKAHDAIHQSRQMQRLAGVSGSRQQRLGRHLAICRDVGDQRRRGAKRRQGEQTRGHSGGRRDLLINGERAPSGAHRLPHRGFCLFHPEIDFSTRDGHLRSVFSGHASKLDAPSKNHGRAVCRICQCDLHHVS